MRNWDTRDESGTDKGCEWEKDWEDVQLVCKRLDIPCELVSLPACYFFVCLLKYVNQIDLSKAYWNRVFEPALRQWELGVTPNPDVWCNKCLSIIKILSSLAEYKPTERLSSVNY